jgi:hypothetical protein
MSAAEFRASPKLEPDDLRAFQRYGQKHPPRAVSLHSAAQRATA